ncbi:1353_t:CDS:2, partial [Paraglomus occultum]
MEGTVSKFVGPWPPNRLKSDDREFDICCDTFHRSSNHMKARFGNITSISRFVNNNSYHWTNIFKLRGNMHTVGKKTPSKLSYVVDLFPFVKKSASVYEQETVELNGHDSFELGNDDRVNLLETQYDTQTQKRGAPICGHKFHAIHHGLFVLLNTFMLVAVFALRRLWNQELIDSYPESLTQIRVAFYLEAITRVITLVLASVFHTYKKYPVLNILGLILGRLDYHLLVHFYREHNDIRTLLFAVEATYLFGSVSTLLYVWAGLCQAAAG